MCVCRLSPSCLHHLPPPDADVAHARATTFPPGSDGHPGQEKEAEGEEKQSGSEPEVSSSHASAAWFGSRRGSRSNRHGIVQCWKLQSEHPDLSFHYLFKKKI